MVRVEELIRRHSHPLIRHYFRSYVTPSLPPSWMLIECMTFGVWSKNFDNLANRADRVLIADQIGIKQIELQSWLRCFTECRNLCAHHERVWNHPYRHASRNAPNSDRQSHRLYQQLHIINMVLKQIAPGTDWLRRLHTLFETYNHLPVFAGMGFDAVWSQDVLWGA